MKPSTDRAAPPSGEVRRVLMTADTTTMRVVLFCHSLLSDWNHGNAHFPGSVAQERVTA